MARPGTYQIANTVSEETFKKFETAFKADKKTDARSVSAWILEQARTNIERHAYIKKKYNHYHVVSFGGNLMTVDHTGKKQSIVVRSTAKGPKFETAMKMTSEDEKELMGFVMASPEWMLLEHPGL